ncbi:MAG: ACP S-malonyltransferase [Peptococcaceae bacterium]|nr:ACP S-malonyltransferase [Peptococcaceae bacterium]
MRIAFVFPGQGSQYVGMGEELYHNFPKARQVFDEADRVLNFPLRELCFRGPKEELQKTVNTQPAVLTTSIACLRVLQDEGVKPHVVAGHSLGEYSALVCSGALAFGNAVKVVRERGRLMQDAVPLGTGGMLAVLGLDRKTLGEVCHKASDAGIIEMANFNCPGQIVLAGELAALEKAVELAKKAGAKRSVMLAVSGSFHSSMMRGAGERLAQVLENVRVKNPQIPVVANVSGEEVKTAAQVRASLVRQIYNPVLWEESVRYMMQEFGVNLFVEVGPGKVLSGLVRKIGGKDIQVTNVEDLASLEKTLALLRGVG